MKLLNAFSLSMIPEGSEEATVTVKRISRLEARSSLFGLGMTCESFVGHADTARLLSIDLNGHVAHNREKTTISNEAIVAQYQGPRLDEGATTLPDNASIQYYTVRIKTPCPDCGEYGCDGCE